MGPILTPLAVPQMQLGILPVGDSLAIGGRRQSHLMQRCTCFGIPPCQRVAYQLGLIQRFSQAIPIYPMRAHVPPLPFRSARYNGTGLPAPSTRWLRRQGVELLRPGLSNAGRGAATPQVPRVDTLIGQAAQGREVVLSPTMPIVNNWPFEARN